VADCYLDLNKRDAAIKELHTLCKSHPNFVDARLKLGLTLYQTGSVVDAIDQWEGVLYRDPSNSKAKQYVRMAQNAVNTSAQL
jgi:predicted Zn-dependent protease